MSGATTGLMLMSPGRSLQQNCGSRQENCRLLQQNCRSRQENCRLLQQNCSKPLCCNDHLVLQLIYTFSCLICEIVVLSKEGVCVVLVLSRLQAGILILTAESAAGIQISALRGSVPLVCISSCIVNFHFVTSSIFIPVRSGSNKELLLLSLLCTQTNWVGDWVGDSVYARWKLTVQVEMHTMTADWYTVVLCKSKYKITPSPFRWLRQTVGDIPLYPVLMCCQGK